MLAYHDLALVNYPPAFPIDNYPLYNLILLGYVSVVESFFREIIRKVVILDAHSTKHCEGLNLKYGAALLHSRELMPEALLEGYSFASSKNIQDALKDFLDLKNIINVPSLREALEQFQDVCQLRHIQIHRYGKLGIDNFIKLRAHSLESCVEKPLEMDASKVYNVSVVCNNLILVFNQYIFSKVLERTAQRGAGIWSWNYNSDKSLFLKYYNVFRCISNPLPTGTSDPKIAYDLLRVYSKTV